ncbi:hypothetical protein RclHR1_04310007 [Rhizophagus clarus]|uniref:3CxxC-type domain-containing protein n=1 Tax=Rhizophagus clarus TaxID=94130 RepID=A0A2Z6RGB0_9GLOM|nr:hypothetical protein RclHR1_04310007 [Rhizophagus clarus]
MKSSIFTSIFGKMNYSSSYATVVLFRNNVVQKNYFSNFGKIMKGDISLSNRSFVKNNIPIFYRKHPYRCEIMRIIRQLVQSKKKFNIYGYIERSCQENCESERRSSNPYTKESLENYLEDTSNELLNERCEKCNKIFPISGFLLYKKSPLKDVKIKPNIKIELNKVWDNYYRVFGAWKCQHCSNKWKSGHTYISLQKFIEKTRLDKDDFYVQKCKMCEEKYNDRCVISNYRPLDGKAGQNRDIPHRVDLCTKCLSGKLCVHYSDYPKF